MVVVDYDPAWPANFEAIRTRLAQSLSAAFRIEHVGSTSVPGLRAKPIIDIDIEIPSPSDLPGIKAELEALGYLHAGDQGIPGREAFKRLSCGDPILDRIPHHLYVCALDSPEYRRRILFRDYLRDHEDARLEYASIKRAILAEHGQDNRAAYVEAKETEYSWFFRKVLKLAESTPSN